MSNSSVVSDQTLKIGSLDHHEQIPIHKDEIKTDNQIVSYQCIYYILFMYSIVFDAAIYEY